VGDPLAAPVENFERTPVVTEEAYAYDKPQPHAVPEASRA